MLRAIMLAILTAALAAFVIGFLGFAEGVRRARPATPLPEADAIVALTGGGPERLHAGMRLLADGRGRRLLISGVNPKVTDAQIGAVLKGPKTLIACCVDYGRRAENTLGNASETALWAQRNSFSRLIIVTDDYHMPRSLTELRQAMPDTALIAYPVASKIGSPGIWQKNPRAATRLFGEYVKYLLIRAREIMRLVDRKPAAAPANP